MTETIDLEGIRERNEALRADLAAVIQPERMMQRIAGDIDALLFEVEALRKLFDCKFCGIRVQPTFGSTFICEACNEANYSITYI